MGEVMAVIIILLLIVMVFVPLAYLNYTSASNEEVKQTLNLSCKVIVNNIENRAANLEGISKGYYMDDISQVNIDMNKLLGDFDELIRYNSGDGESFDKIKRSILLKALVLKDKFFMTKKVETLPGVFEDQWGPPYFFTTAIYEGGKENLIYLNTKDDRVVYFEGGTEKRDKVLSDFQGGITRKEKSQLIIDKINLEMEKATREIGVRKGIGVKIRNPYDTGIDNAINYANVNVLDGGITFFVLYGDNTLLNANGKDFNFKNYNVAGYSMSY
ncbi:MAG TPA: hypothetical protein VIO64_12240 [Pseudobacteroides sp.]|uniref:hypothetical protein n=1 Tax=Pseudobacteroides sp. TaxID=1968840 RepID=UPI002F92639D